MKRKATEEDETREQKHPEKKICVPQLQLQQNRLDEELGRAVYDLRTDTVASLLKEGADPNATMRLLERDRERDFYIMEHSSSTHSIPIIQVAIRDWNVRFHCSATHHILKLLLGAGADPNTRMVGNAWSKCAGSIPEHSMTILHTLVFYACQIRFGGLEDHIKLLLEHKADVNARTIPLPETKQWYIPPREYTPLDILVFKLTGKDETFARIAQILLDNKADTNGSNLVGESYMDITFANRYDNLMTTLFRAGVDPMCSVERNPGSEMTKRLWGTKEMFLGEYEMKTTKLFATLLKRSVKINLLSALGRHPSAKKNTGMWGRIDKHPLFEINLIRYIANLGAPCLKHLHVDPVDDESEYEEQI